MANPILPYLATGIAMEGINAQLNRLNSTQVNPYQFPSGILGEWQSLPFFFAHQTIKVSTQQFPTEKTLWGAVKKYSLLNKGQNWNRYANLQGIFSLRGATRSNRQRSQAFVSGNFKSELRASGFGVEKAFQRSLFCEPDYDQIIPFRFDEMPDRLLHGTGTE